jgi:hypothetical protein
MKAFMIEELEQRIAPDAIGGTPGTGTKQQQRRGDRGVERRHAAAGTVGQVTSSP